MPPSAERTSFNALANTFRGTDYGSGGYFIPECGILHLFSLAVFLVLDCCTHCSMLSYDPSSPQLTHVFLLSIILLPLHPRIALVAVLTL
jgi:hypothetical protein